MPKQDVLSSLSVKKLREMFKGKDLPTTRNKTVWINRLLDAQYELNPAVVKLQS